MPEPVDWPESRAILIGVSTYQDQRLPAIPAAANSLMQLQAVLTDPQLCGWPIDRVTVVTDPSDSRAVATRIRRLAQETSGVLLLYYVGHGTLTPYGELCLTLADTDAEAPDLTGVEYARIRSAFRDSPARVKAAILDCCYSGRAIEALADQAAVVADHTDIRGVYTLTSSDLAAHVPPPEEQTIACTSFTGELMELIRTGIPGQGDSLTLGTLYLELRRRLRARGLPDPNQRGTDTAHSFAFTRNAAALPPAPPEPMAPGDTKETKATAPTDTRYVPIERPPRPSLWHRVIIAAAAGMTAGILLADWRLGVMAAILTAIGDMVYRTKKRSSVPAWRRISSVERCTEGQLKKLERSGYRALYARVIPSSNEQIDHLVVGPTGVYVVDSERWDARLAVHVRSHHNELFHGPFNQRPLLDKARRKASEASRLISKAVGRQITVVPALAIYGPWIPWNVLNVRDVDVFDGRRVRRWITKRETTLTDGNVEKIYEAARAALPSPSGQNDRERPLTRLFPIASRTAAATAATPSVLVVAAALVTWFDLNHSYIAFGLLTLPWAAIPIVLALGEAYMGWRTRARLNPKPGAKPVGPRAVASLTVLANGSAVAGAIFAGIFAGAVLAALDGPSFGGWDALIGVGAFVSCVLLVCAALYLEFCCRIPLEGTTAQPVDGMDQPTREQLLTRRFPVASRTAAAAAAPSVLVVAALVTWFDLNYSYFDSGLLTLPWAAIPIVLALGEAYMGWRTRARLNPKPGAKPVGPRAVASLTVLANGSAVAGAIFAGIFASAVLAALDLLSFDRGRTDALVGVGAFVSCVLLVCAALYLEFCCRVPMGGTAAQPVDDIDQPAAEPDPHHAPSAASHPALARPPRTPVLLVLRNAPREVLGMALLVIAAVLVPFSLPAVAIFQIPVLFWAAGAVTILACDSWAFKDRLSGLGAPIVAYSVGGIVLGAIGSTSNGFASSFMQVSGTMFMIGTGGGVLWLGYRLFNPLSRPPHRPEHIH
ncbi:DUF3180 family protein [Nonomuraea sp. MTCD27]|uniref:caspase, EACC1-associated type n=1 Tax=Nonomuraea sp. MTCD27 TaxID=1676747 RepID=UPI0035C04AA1